MPRLERNDGGSAPTFCHAWTADCASPAIFRLLPRAAEGDSSAPVYRKTGKTDVANESALRSARSCRDRRDGRIGGRRAESRPGQTGAKTVCRKLRILPSQPARSCQGPLSPHALSVSAKTLFQRFQFGLGADVLSGIDRQRKARRGEAAGGKHRAVIVASAGAGAGAIGAQRARSRLAHRYAAKSPQGRHLFDLCRPSILGVRVAGSTDDGGGRA
jgi:hypothetical protein